MRSQVRGGDNDKLCFSVVSDRERERWGERKGKIETSAGESSVKSDFIIEKATFPSVQTHH